MPFPMLCKFAGLLLLLSCADALRMRKSARFSDASLSGESFWDKYGDGVKQGLGVVADNIVGADDTLKDAGTFIKNVGGFVGTVVPPPHGVILGSVFGIVGGLFGLKKAPAGPTPPSNQDVINALGKGLRQIGRQLDGLDRKLDGLDRKVDHVLSTAKYVAATTRKTLDIVGAHFDAYLLEPIKKIHAVFKDAMERLGEAMRDPQNDLSFKYFLEKVEFYAKSKSHKSFECFSVDNVERILNEVVKIRIGGIGAGPYRCVASEVYRDIVAARVELFWILYMGTVFRPGLAGQSVVYAKRLKTDMEDYHKIIVPKFDLDDHLMSASLRQLTIAKKHRYKVKLPAGILFHQSLLHQSLAQFKPLPAEVSELLTANSGPWPLNPLVGGGHGPGDDFLYVIGKDLNGGPGQKRQCKVHNAPHFEWADNKFEQHRSECTPIIAKRWAVDYRDCSCGALLCPGPLCTANPDICVIRAKWVESTCFAVVKPESDEGYCGSGYRHTCRLTGQNCYPAAGCCSGYCHYSPPATPENPGIFGGTCVL